MAVLASRNLYDDELASFDLIERSLPDLWAAANVRDVHPPGMYALAKLAGLLVPHERWAVVVPLGLAALGIVLALRLLSTATEDEGRGWHPMAIVLADLAPQWLVWTNSNRWYAWWSPPALVLLSLVAVRGVRRLHPILLGVVFAVLFYISYATVLLCVAVVVCDAVFAWRGREDGRPWLRTWGWTGLVTAVLVAPQIGSLLGVHLPASSTQRGGLLPTSLRFAHGMLQSEGLLPWSAGGVVAALLTIGGVALLVPDTWRGPANCRARLVTVVLIVTALAVGTGLGVKPRSFVALAPLFALLIADSLLRWARRRGLRMQLVVMALVAFEPLQVITNLVRREGLMKAAMTDKPEQVVQVLERMSEARPAAETLVFVRDPGVVYALALARSQGRLLRVIPCPMRPRSLPARLRLFAAESYVAGYLGSDLVLADRFKQFDELVSRSGNWWFGRKSRLTRRLG